MSNAAFVLFLGGFCSWLLVWGGRNLPRAEWQFLASVPSYRQEDGRWRGMNLTFYGFFVASASVAGSALALVLIGAAGVSTPKAVCLLAGILAIGLPLSRSIARWVERKPATFTVGGAYFGSLILAPVLVVAANRLPGHPFEVGQSMAVLTVAYAFGEGLGRMACLSFGCCYGKPLAAMSPRSRRILSGFELIFTGETKKIAYEHGSEGIGVIPIQVLTAAWNFAASLAGILLYLGSHFRLSFLLTALGIQGWRFASEFLRADDRGGGRMSAYQVMALLVSAYAIGLASFLPPSTSMRPDLVAGLKGLWDPSLILGLEALWVSLFLFTGRSRVTGSELVFFVYRDRI